MPAAAIQVRRVQARAHLLILDVRAGELGILHLTGRGAAWEEAAERAPKRRWSELDGQSGGCWRWFVAIKPRRSKALLMSGLGRKDALPILSPQACIERWRLLAPAEPPS